MFRVQNNEKRKRLGRTPNLLISICFSTMLLAVLDSYCQIFNARSDYGINVADSLYNDCNYEAALLEYKNSMSFGGDTGYYSKKMCAKCFANLLSPKDSVFEYLFIVVNESNRFNYFDLADCSFDPYVCYPEWNEISDIYIKKKFSGKSKLEIDFTLAFATDQKFRGISQCKREFLSSRGYDSLMPLQNKIDIRNESLLVEYFIDSDNEIPSFETMRNAYNGSMLVLWHASPSVLKKMKKHVAKSFKEGRMTPDDYIMYIDKLKVNTGRKQVYGTQYFFNKKNEKMELAPMRNPNKLKKRQIKVGLTPSVE